MNSSGVRGTSRRVSIAALLLIVGGVILFADVHAGHAAPVDLAAVQREIEAVAKGDVAPGSSRFDQVRGALERFYRSRRYGPVWLVADGASANATTAVAEIAGAPDHGLLADDYDADQLTEELAVVAADPPPRRLARFDVALTASMLSYLADLHRGRVSPGAAGFRLTVPADAFDAVAALDQALAENRISAAVVAAEPSFAVYRRLKEVLARYRSFAGAAWAPLQGPRGKTKIEPGDAYGEARALAERLRTLGDLPHDATLPVDGRYDGEIVGAVRRFQARHGLAQDGVLGAETLREINVPPAIRARQIALSMERLRWLPHFRPGPIVAINVPSYTLWALDAPLAAGTQPLSMRVIVGRAALQTPIFIANMRFVEFSPFWNVPRAIQKKEIVPRIMRDPGYLEREDMEIVGRDAANAPVKVLDETTLDRLAQGELRIRQRPGPKNALGGVKFVLPNAMDIYLHGTPAQELFERTRRDFSHGCIRVADPLALARFVLRDRADWTADRMRDAMAERRPSSVPLTEPIPVVIFYTTAIADSDGRAQFIPDVYGYDERLERALAARTRRREPALSHGFRSPPAHATGVDMNEVRSGIVADAARP